VLSPSVSLGVRSPPYRARAKVSRHSASDHSYTNSPNTLLYGNYFHAVHTPVVDRGRQARTPIDEPIARPSEAFNCFPSRSEACRHSTRRARPSGGP
jgi:hypothetical protein